MCVFSLKMLQRLFPVLALAFGMGPEEMFHISEARRDIDRRVLRVTRPTPGKPSLEIPRVIIGGVPRLSAEEVYK